MHLKKNWATLRKVRNNWLSILENCFKKLKIQWEVMFIKLSLVKFRYWLIAMWIVQLKRLNCVSKLINYRTLKEKSIWKMTSFKQLETIILIWFFNSKSLKIGFSPQTQTIVDSKTFSEGLLILSTKIMCLLQATSKKWTKIILENWEKLNL